ncbi:CDP-glycerol glycerophosphotransferase family protein [Paenibacillus terrigena]|uniref:CDP-glycerol glycerophosphotransferase family protein n=1 Tax=Paenibacillus terrigena TaxID=369333 RepID=UPI000363254F|nr:CDP-glycerol glycerophosphotransferase family protein [Paenibacillus terrigena]
MQELKRAILFYSLTILNSFFVKKNNKIAVYGRTKLENNSEAILKYLIENGYNEKYEIVCLLRNYKDYEKYTRKNMKFVSKTFKTLYHLFTSKYIFNSQTLSVAAFKPLYGQITMNIWHGSPLKALGRMVSKKETMHYPTKADTYFLVASVFFKQKYLQCYNYKEEQYIIGGNPRNDLLFSEKSCLKILGISQESYKKVVLFMPTFRNSKELGRNDSNKEFPLITLENIDYVNSFLKENRILCIIKPHPYQDNISFLNSKYSNIVKYNNDDLIRSDINLYELLGQVDALITDYSSVYFDFLILDKPIGFAIEDLSNYNDSRGFTVDNPLDFMPGPKIYDINDFLNFFISLNKEDQYSLERKRINEIANRYTDNKNTERILTLLNISRA